MSMEEWKEYKLEDLCNGKGSYGIGASAVPFSKDKFTYLRITDINDDGTLNKSGLMSVADEDANKYILENNDIVFARTGNSTGRSYFYDGTDGTLVYAGFLIKFSLDEEKVNPRILKYYTHSKPYYDWVKSFDTGGTRGNINAKTYGALPISLPPRKVQDRIVEILKSLDDKIEVNRRINAELEELAQTLFKSWFVDFEPFKDSEFVESELGMIPKGWKVVSLGELMKYSGGSQPPASEFIEEYKEGYIRFIQIRDYASESHITYIPISKKNKLCDVKDIMIARYGASLGRICYGLKGAYNVALAKVTPLKEYYREFLRCYLSSKEFYEGLNMKGNRAVQAGFNQGDIDSFMLPFPTNENIIMKYEAVSALLFEKRLHNQQEITHLTALRDTLLPKLMSGEIDVNDVNI